MAGVEDMIALTAATEEQTKQEILNNLQERYEAGIAYTDCGPTLVAVNLLGAQNARNTPFDKTVKQAYWNDEPSPHAYRLAKESFDRMWAEQRNQAIIITGESGAGKTFNTKNMLKFMDSKPRAEGVDDLDFRSSNVVNKATGLTKLLIKTSPIFEAFGNAVMERNDDSSRFGRLYKMYFDRRSQELSGCQITPYLLEKSRVTTQAANERSFHIFYQMKHFIEVGSPSGKDYEQYKQAWMLDGRFQYLAGGHAHPKSEETLHHESDALEARGITKAKDAEDFQETVDALIQFTQDEPTVDVILNIMAGLLHLGQVNIQPKEFDEDFACQLSDIENGPSVQEQLQRAAALLQLDPALVADACTKNTILMGGKRRDLGCDAASGRRYRDAMARSIYDAVFDKLVNCINERLCANLDEEKDFFLAVLDIFGFEFTEHPDPQAGSVNSFEQFCINMCNEQLQERFMGVVIDSEKQLVERELPNEQVDLGDFDGYDYKVMAIMQGCSRPDGSKDEKDYFQRGQNVMTLLNDASKGERGSIEAKQEKFVGTVEKLLKGQKGHDKPLSNVTKGVYKEFRGRAFSLGHYAGNVTYDLDGWVEKNKNKSTFEVEACLSQSSDMVVLAPAFEVNAQGQTLVAMEFKNKLSKLTEVLRGCSLRFVRCLKAKGKTEEGLWENAFNSQLVTKQLQYTGMYQALEVSKSSYAFKATHTDFMRKYVPAIHYHAAKCQFNSQKIAAAEFKMSAFFSLEQAVSVFNEEHYESELKVGATMILSRTTAAFGILQRYCEEYHARMQIDLAIWKQNRDEAAKLELREKIIAYARKMKEDRLAAAKEAQEKARQLAALKAQGTPCCLALDGDYDTVMDSAESENEFKARLRADLAKKLGVPESRIKLTGLSAGSIMVDFTLDDDPDDPSASGAATLEAFKQRMQSGESVELAGCSVNNAKSLASIDVDPQARLKRMEESERDESLRKKIQKLEKEVLGAHQSGPLITRLEELEQKLSLTSDSPDLPGRVKQAEKAWRDQKRKERKAAVPADISKKDIQDDHVTQPSTNASRSNDPLFQLYEACATGKTNRIAQFIRRHKISRLLPTDCLMAAIYSLEMEAVNFLVHSGLVDPTIQGSVPLRKSNTEDPPSLDSVGATDMVDVDVRYNGGLDHVKASRNDKILELKHRIHAQRAEDNRKQIPINAMILTCNGCAMADHERVHEFLDGQTLVLKLGKKHGNFSDDLVPFASVPEFRRLDDDFLREMHTPYDLASKMLRRCRKTKKKEEIGACEFLKAWFKTDAEKEKGDLTKPDMDWTVVQKALDSALLFEDEREVYELFDVEIKALFDTLHPTKPSSEEGGLIEPGVLLELMEDLGHDYTFQEVQQIIPLGDIDVNVFRAVMTSIYMRALNRWCPVKDGINLVLEDSKSKQFQTSDNFQDDSQGKSEAKLEAVLFDIGIETRASYAKQEIHALVNNEDARVKEDTTKLLFGDFCVLATRLIVKGRGGACAQCLQHCGYKLEACYNSSAFIVCKYLLLVVFCIFTVVACVFAYESVDNTSFQRMITNWETVPLTNIQFKAAVTTVTGTTTSTTTPACDSGWESAPSVDWPGASAGPCVCPSTSAYSSSTGACSSTQEAGGCITQAAVAGVSSVSTTSGIGTICFLRAGAPCATWIGGAYEERPMLSSTASSDTIAASCPATHTQCGAGMYGANGMCQATGVTCPIRKMVVFQDQSTWATYSSQGYTSYTLISPVTLAATSQRYIAWDNPTSTTTARARDACELDMSLSTKCADGTSITYAGQSSITATASASNSYTSTGSCTASEEWFTVDTVAESTSLGNAIATAAVCSTQSTTVTAVRRSETAMRRQQNEDDDEPPDWWTDIVECPTEDSSVQTLDAKVSQENTKYSQWVTDASGSKCKAEFVPPPEQSAEEREGLAPHLWPVSEDRRHLVERPKDHVPTAFLNGENLTPQAAARRLFADTCTTDSSCTTKADIVFVMDASGSVGRTNYYTMLDFANLVIEQLTIGPTETQVGFLVYSLTPTYTARRRRRVMRRRNYEYSYDSYYTRWHFKIGDYDVKADMKNAVSNSPYPSSGTWTGEAIRWAQEELTTVTTGGSRAASTGVAKIMIVLTDGYATDFSRWNTATDTSYCGISGSDYATVAKAAGISVFALGVSGYDASQINGIASNPDTTYARTEGQFSALVATSFITTLKENICSTAAPVTSDVAVSTECCALDAYTYYQFNAPAGSSARTIEADVSSGGVQLEYNGASNVAGVDDSTNPVQPTSYQVCSGSSTTSASDAVGAGTCVSATSVTWTPACTAGKTCVFWVRSKCTAASTNFSVTQRDDVTPPVIVTYNPAQASVTYDATAFADIKMTFSEGVQIDPTTGSVSTCLWSITPVTAGAAASWYLQNSDTAKVSYAVDTNMVTLVSNSGANFDLDAGIEYQVTIGATCVTDLSNVNFAGLATGVYKFSTTSTTRPEIVSYSPVQGALGVAAGDTIAITFSTPIRLSSGNPAEQVLTLTQQAVPTNSPTTTPANTMTCKIRTGSASQLQPSPAPTPTTSYYTATGDTSGGLTQSLCTVSITNTGGQGVLSINFADPSASQPGYYDDSITKYAVTMTAFFVENLYCGASGACADAQRNTGQPILTSDTDLNYIFSTQDVTAPQITAYSPLQQATSVAVDTGITLTFSEIVKLSTTSSLLTFTLHSWTRSGSIVSEDTADKRTVTMDTTMMPGTTQTLVVGAESLKLNGANLIAGRRYSVDLIAASVTDAGQSKLVSGLCGSCLQYYFDVIDTAAPTIVNYSPCLAASGDLAACTGATSVAVASDVSFTFKDTGSEVTLVDGTTIQLYLGLGTTLLETITISGTTSDLYALSTSAIGYTCTEGCTDNAGCCVTPNANAFQNILKVNFAYELQSATQYSVALGGVVQDELGNAFAGLTAGSYYFTTADTIKPYIISYLPLDSAQDVDPSSTTSITLTFNEAVQADTCTAPCISLAQTTQSWGITFAATRYTSADGTVVSPTPAPSITSVCAAPTGTAGQTMRLLYPGQKLYESTGSTNSATVTREATVVSYPGVNQDGSYDYCSVVVSSANGGWSNGLKIRGNLMTLTIDGTNEVTSNMWAATSTGVAGVGDSAYFRKSGLSGTVHALLTPGTVDCASSTAVVGSSTVFAAAFKVGDIITIKGAGTAGADHTSTISAVGTDTSITLNTACASTVTGVLYGPQKFDVVLPTTNFETCTQITCCQSARLGGTVAVTSSGTTLTGTSTFFRQLSTGAQITIAGAGASGADLVTTVASVASDTSLTLAAAAGTTVTAANYYFGSYASGCPVFDNYPTGAVAVQMTSGANTVTAGARRAATLDFTTEFSVGDSVTVYGAGAAGGNLVSIITAVTTSQLTLTDNAGTTIASTSYSGNKGETIEFSSSGAYGTFSMVQRSLNNVGDFNQAAKVVSWMLETGTVAVSGTTVTGTGTQFPSSFIAGESVTLVQDSGVDFTTTIASITDATTMELASAPGSTTGTKPIGPSRIYQDGNGAESITKDSTATAEVAYSSSANTMIITLGTTAEAAAGSLLGFNTEYSVYMRAASVKDSASLTFDGIPFNYTFKTTDFDPAPTSAPTSLPSFAPSAVGPSGTPAPTPVGNCATDDTLCSTSSRTTCDTAEQYATDATANYYLQYSREAQWTPECKYTKDSVYQRREEDNRDEKDWALQLLIVHVIMVLVLLVAGLLLELYNYHKTQGTMCFPPWLVHTIRIIAIILAILLLFYACLVAWYTYNEWQYYDTVISEGCTSGDYVPNFQTMESALQDMFFYDIGVLVFDILIVLWFLTILCCLSVKVRHQYDPNAWSCWDSDLREYAPAGNGLSENCADWDAALPEETGIPCANAFCCGCSCCKMNPDGPRIDLDVLGARRRMYMKPDGEVAAPLADGVDDTTSMGQLLQGVHAVLVPAIIMPEITDKGEIMDAIEMGPSIAFEEASGIREDMLIMGKDHATVALAELPTWHVTDDSTISSSDVRNDMDGFAPNFEDLKDRLTDDSLKALDEAFKRAGDGEITTDLELTLRDPVDSAGGNVGHGKSGGKKKKKKKKPIPTIVDDFDTLNDVMEMISPDGKDELKRNILNLVEHGDFDKFLDSHGLTDDVIINLVGQPPDNEDSNVGHGRPGGRKKKPKERLIEAIIDGQLESWDDEAGDMKVFSFNHSKLNPEDGLKLHALDEEIRNVLKDQDNFDIETKFIDDEHVFGDGGPPLSEVYSSLTPDSQDTVTGAVRQMAEAGEFDDLLNSLSLTDDIIINITAGLKGSDDEDAPVGDSHGRKPRSKKSQLIEALFDPDILNSVDPELLSIDQKEILERKVRKKLCDENLDLEEKDFVLGDMIDFDGADLQDFSSLLLPLSQTEQDRIKREIENLISSSDMPFPDLVEDNVDFLNMKDVQAYITKISGDVKTEIENKIKSDMDDLTKIAKNVSKDFDRQDVLAVLGLDPGHLSDMMTDGSSRQRVDALEKALFEKYWLTDLHDFVEDQVREKGRKMQPNDILGVLGFEPCTLTDEFRCETERFLRPYLKQQMKFFALETVEEVPDRIFLDIAPVLGFKADEQHNFTFHNSHSYVVQQKTEENENPVIMFQICPQTDSSGGDSSDKIRLKDLPSLSFETLQDFDSAIKHGLTDDSYNRVLDKIESDMDALVGALPNDIEEFEGGDGEDSGVGHGRNRRNRPKRKDDVRSILGFIPSNLTDACMDQINDILKRHVKNLVGDMEVEMQSHGTSIIDANPGAAVEMGFNKMSDLLGMQFSDFLSEESQVVFDNKVNELVNHDTDVMREFTLNFNTPDGRVLYASTSLSIDRDVGMDNEYLPMVICRLFPRPIWVDVQNGPVLLTFRDAEIKKTYDGSSVVEFIGSDFVTFSNDKASSITQAHPEYDLLTTYENHARAESCMDATFCAARGADPEQNKALEDAMRALDEQYGQATNTGPARLGAGFGEAVPFPLQKFQRNPASEQIEPTGELTEVDARLSLLWSGPNEEFNEYLNVSGHDDALCGVLIDASDSLIFSTDSKGRVLDMNDTGIYFLASESEDGQDSDALDAINRHYSRYVDKVNRKEVKQAFDHVLNSGSLVKLKRNVTLVSNDFTFEVGAVTDLLARLVMYPRYDKRGHVCGVVFEAQNISNEKLMADIYSHVLSHSGDPLKYNDEELQDQYEQGEERVLREHHAPLLAIESNRLYPDSTKILAATHAAMLKLELDPTHERDRIMTESFADYLDPDSLARFLEERDHVLKTSEPCVVDLYIKTRGKAVATMITMSPWYDDSAQIKGIIVSFEGELSGFSLDSDGYVTDCTDAAARHLGYEKEDIFGKALVTFVDEDSLLMMGDSIMDIMDEDYDELESLDEVPDQVCQVTMVRQSGRMVQTTWDMTRIEGANPKKKYAMVVMHKEKWLGVRGRERARRGGTQNEKEDVHLKHAPEAPELRRPGQKPAAAKESVELTALERAETELEPVRFHYVVMQKKNNINKPCDFDAFKIYLRVMNPPEQRPWGLHKTNCFMKRAMQTKFKEISGGELGNFSFEQWSAWWHQTPNRSGWDGGPKMEHINPPGKQLATEFD